MGGGESKGQITPPETPVYRKYSHLKELVDPRSPMPCGSQRTPMIQQNETTQLIDPRSPSCALTRTPVYCIPEPEENEFSFEFAKETEVKPEEPAGDKVEESAAENGPNKMVEPEAEKVEEAQPESSPEKAVTEFSEKGYLISKNKPNAGAKKRRRRKNNKRKNNENKISKKSEKKIVSLDLENQPPRSPLVTRNFISLDRNRSPSVDCLVKNTKGLSINRKTRPVSFPDLENFGKENFAATFSP